jgi:hypothetical protein
MRSGAFLAALIFVIALPDDFLVFVRAVPDLRAVPAAALTAFYLAGEVTDTTVTIPSRAAAFRPACRAEMPLIQAFLRLSHQRSTVCHCIKDGTPIDPAGGLCNKAGELLG